MLKIGLRNLKFPFSQWVFRVRKKVCEDANFRVKMESQNSKSKQRFPRAIFLYILFYAIVAIAAYLLPGTHVYMSH